MRRSRRVSPGGCRARGDGGSRPLHALQSSRCIASEAGRAGRARLKCRWSNVEHPRAYIFPWNQSVLMASVSTAVKLFVKSRTRSGGATLGRCSAGRGEPSGFVPRAVPRQPRVTLHPRAGDCPFCHKVMLVAALRRASFSTVLIDLENKPTWFAPPPRSRAWRGSQAGPLSHRHWLCARGTGRFLEMTDGKGTTPAMKVEGSSPRVLADSSDIVEWLLTHGDGPPVQRSTEALDRMCGAAGRTRGRHAPHTATRRYAAARVSSVRS